MTGQEARDDEREALEEWSFEHRPILSMRDGSIASCKCMDRVFINGHEDWDQHLADSLVAAGYRKHPEPEITDEMVDRALAEYLNLHRDATGQISLKESMRAALNAALRVPVGEGEQSNGRSR